MSILTKTFMLSAVAAILFAFGYSAPSHAQTQVAAAHAQKSPMQTKRSNLMRSNVRTMRAIRQGDNSKAATIVANLKALAAADLWPRGSAKGTRAKPALFQNFDDYKTKLAATQKVAEAVVAGTANAKALNDSCNVCHRAYRGPRPGGKGKGKKGRRGKKRR